MIENSPTNVLVAFEILLDEIEAKLEALNEIGDKAFKECDYDTVSETHKHANQIIAFQEKLVALCEGWETLELTHPQRTNMEEGAFREEGELLAEAFRENLQALEATQIPRANGEDEVLHIEQHFLGRLQRGLCTPRKVYCQPILEALNGLGGSGETSDILDRVEQKMKGILREVDYELIPSGSDIRWRKTAQWVRYTMARKGLLRSDSPWGRWEITEAGRMALTEGAS